AARRTAFAPGSPGARPGAPTPAGVPGAVSAIPGGAPNRTRATPELLQPTDTGPTGVSSTSHTQPVTTSLSPRRAHAFWRKSADPSARLKAPAVPARALLAAVARQLTASLRAPKQGTKPLTSRERGVPVSCRH